MKEVHPTFADTHDFSSHFDRRG